MQTYKVGRYEVRAVGFERRRSGPRKRSALVALWAVFFGGKRETDRPMTREAAIEKAREMAGTRLQTA